jgi:hypothetical protein
MRWASIHTQEALYPPHVQYFDTSINQAFSYLTFSFVPNSSAQFKYPKPLASEQISNLGTLLLNFSNS